MSQQSISATVKRSRQLVRHLGKREDESLAQFLQRLDRMPQEEFNRLYEPWARIHEPWVLEDSPRTGSEPSSDPTAPQPPSRANG